MAFWLRPSALLAPEGDTAGSGGGHDPNDPGGREDPGDGDTDPNAPVSRAMITELLTSQRKAIESAHQRRTQALEREIRELRDQLPKRSDPGEGDPEPSSGRQPSGGKEKESNDPAVNAEIAKMRREVERLRREHDEAVERAKKADQAARDNKFENELRDALTAAGCTAPAEVLRAIRNDVSRELVDETRGEERYFVRVKGEYGEEDQSVSDWIDTTVRRGPLKALFRSSASPGTPAGREGGSAGSGSRPPGRVYKVSQWKDPAFFAEHKDELVKAAAEGRIEPD